MIIKNFDLKKNLKKNINFYLLYGPNAGFIEETINNTFKPIFSKNIFNYDESEILLNINGFKESIFNKSFFDNEKLIIINRGSDKILSVLEDIINKGVSETTLIIKSNPLLLFKYTNIIKIMDKNNKYKSSLWSRIKIFLSKILNTK